MATSNSRIETDCDEFPGFAQLHSAQSGSPPISDNNDDFRQFIPSMPLHYQNENFDGLIICSPTDKPEAYKFKNHLSNIKFEFFNRTMKPKIKVVDDIRGTEINSLDNLLERSTITFLFWTKSFYEEKWSELVSNACLKRAIDTDSKDFNSTRVIPVFTKPDGDYPLPALLVGIKPINYFHIDQFYKESLRSMFKKLAHVRVRKDLVLDEERRQYYGDNKMQLRGIYQKANMCYYSQQPVNEVYQKSEDNSPAHVSSRSFNSSQNSLSSNEDNTNVTNPSWSSSDSSSLAGQVSSSGNNSRTNTEISFNVHPHPLPMHSSDISNLSDSYNFSHNSELSKSPQILIHKSIHIEKAENVIIGNDGKICIQNDTEDNDKIFRPPQAEPTVDTMPATSQITNEDIAIEGFPELSISSNDNNSDEYSVVFHDNEEGMRVKFHK